jgi:predicted HTH domain antitoxin
VLIVLVDTESNVYWEHLRPGACEETEEGFRLKITAAQKLDADSLTKLAEIAGRADENLELKIDKRYAVLPSDTVRALKRAFSSDPMRASRVAAHLADGRMNPRSAASALTAGSPTWITDSPAAEDLWLAVASFAYDHDEEDLASTAYQLAGSCAGGQSARAIAYAALTAYATDEQEALRLAEVAVAAGGGILADAALAITQLPRDTAGILPVPLSIQQAGEEELDREPTVRNFLGELATRSGDLAEGIRQRRAAVAAGGTNAHGMQLMLAQTLLRRATNEGFGHGPDIRDALDAAHAALAEQRRFGGPSHKALETVLDIYIAIPELDDAITAALPAAAGGTALDAEAGVQAVARRGAMAAFGRGRHEAAEHFLALLEEGPGAREMRAIAESLNERLTRDEEVLLWQGLLAEADSDAMLARCAAHLAALGSWPDRVDELVARELLPAIEFDILNATFQYASGEDAGRARLLALADRTPRAAHALIEQVCKRGDLAGAVNLCRDQIARWDDAELNVLLADLLREAGRDIEAADHIAVQVKNAKLPVALRLSLARWLVRHLHDAGDLDAAISTARRLSRQAREKSAWTTTKSAATTAGTDI